MNSGWKKSTVIIRDHIIASDLLSKAWVHIAQKELANDPAEAKYNLSIMLRDTFFETCDTVMDSMPSPFKALAEDALHGIEWELISDHLLTLAYRQPLKNEA